MFKSRLGTWYRGGGGGVPTFKVSIFGKNSRTGYKISVKIPEQAYGLPEQVKFILNALLSVKNSDLNLQFFRVSVFRNPSSEQGKKNFICRHFPVHKSAVIPRGGGVSTSTYQSPSRSIANSQDQPG